MTTAEAPADAVTSEPEAGPAPSGFSTLGEIPARWRDADPDAPAVITGDRTVTAGELADLVDAQVAALGRLTPPGSRVAVHAPASVANLALLYAVPAAGRVLVPLNIRLAHTELVAQLHRTDAALLLGDPVTGFAGPAMAIDDLTNQDRRVEAPDAPTTRTDDVAWVIFTSGSTGAPKGVLITHGSLAAAVATTAAARPLADDEVYLYPFPLFHVAAYNVVHAHARRRPVVLPDRFDPEQLIGLCNEHRVTAVSLAATMLRMVLDALAEDPRLEPPPSLRTIAYGAAPMPEGLLRAAHAVLDCDFAQGYGMTELSGNAVFLPPEAHRRGLDTEPELLTAAGWAGPGVSIRIVDDAGAPVPAGLPGEITIASAQVCAGYLDDRAATAAAIRDGWLHTGDIGTLDDDGLLRIVDRAKDIVVTGGENVSSREVEDVLRTHPSVADVAVIGTPHNRWGEAVTAVVVPTTDPAADPAGAQPSAPVPGASDPLHEAPAALATELAAHVAASLAGFKKPRRVLVTSALPLNANGKVDKPALRARCGR